MEDKLVTLAIRTYQRAQMIKAVLQEEGIETVIHEDCGRNGECLGG